MRAERVDVTLGTLAVCGCCPTERPGHLRATQRPWPGSWHADAFSNKERSRAEHVEYHAAGHEIHTVIVARRSIVIGAGDKRESVRRRQHERRCRNGRLK